jgi:urease subunit alpha
VERGIREKLGLVSQVEAVRGIRSLTKKCLVRNCAMPHIEVDPETFAVKADGVHLTVPAVQKVSLGQLYFFS